MALNQTGLDPLSRPGSVFAGLGANPIEIWQKRAELEGKQAAADAAKKAAEDKAKADALKMPTFGKVALPHSNEWMGIGNKFLQSDAERWKLYDQTKDENLNPMNPASEAYMKRQSELIGMQQYAAMSEEKEKRYNTFRTSYDQNPNKYTPEEVKAWEAYYRSSPMDELAGTVVAPDILGTWEKTADIDAILKTITPTGFGGASWDPDLDMFTTTTGEKVTADDLREAANATAGPRTKIGLQYMREYNLKSDDQKQAIAEKAKKAGVTIEQQLAYEDLYGYAYRTANTTKQKAGLKQAKWGTGWGEDEAAADRFVRYILGITKNDPSVLDESFEKITSGPWYQGEGVQVYKSSGLNGMQIGGTTKDPITIKGIYKVGDKTIVETSEMEEFTAYQADPNKKGAIKQYKDKRPKQIVIPTGRFANDFIEVLQEYNAEIKKGQVENKLKEYNAVDEYGNIVVGEVLELPSETGIVKKGTPENPKGTTIQKPVINGNVR